MGSFERTGGRLLSPKFLKEKTDPSSLPQIYQDQQLWARSRFSEVLKGDQATAKREFFTWWDIGERAANALRLTGQGEYGAFSERAYNNPFLPQHNHEHGRRVEHYMEDLLFRIDGIINPSIPPYVILASTLYPYLHDADQLASEQRNFDAKNAKLTPKHAHGPAAGLKILAQTEEYAKALGVDFEDARKITGTAAFMMIKHEEPAQLITALKGTQVLPDSIPIEELVKTFDENHLDLARLPVSQLIRIILYKKDEKGYITYDTPHGLTPDFEKTYRKQLEDLSKDTSPLIPGYDDKTDREGLHALTLISNLSDLFDMIMPAKEALVRKLGVDKSLKRPFYKKEFTLEQIMNQATGKDGHFEPEVGSDLARILWELDHPLDINPGSLIEESPYAKDLIKQTVISGALTLRAIGASLMRGNFLPIERIYAKRISALAEKILTKNGFSPQKMNGEEAEMTLAAQGAPTQRIKALREEKEELIRKITPKFIDAEGERIYSDLDIQRFTEVIDVALNRFQLRHKVSDAELKIFQDQIESGEVYGMPFAVYDSSMTINQLRSSEGPRTIFPITQH